MLRLHGERQRPLSGEACLALHPALRGAPVGVIRRVTGQESAEAIVGAGSTGLPDR